MFKFYFIINTTRDRWQLDLTWLTIFFSEIVEFRFEIPLFFKNSGFFFLNSTIFEKIVEFKKIPFLKKIPHVVFMVNQVKSSCQLSHVVYMINPTNNSWNFQNQSKSYMWAVKFPNNLPRAAHQWDFEWMFTTHVWDFFRVFWNSTRG